PAPIFGAHDQRVGFARFEESRVTIFWKHDCATSILSRVPRRSTRCVSTSRDAARAAMAMVFVGVVSAACSDPIDVSLGGSVGTSDSDSGGFASCTGAFPKNGAPTVVWAKQPTNSTFPGYVTNLVFPFDPVSNQAMLWANNGGN